MSCDYTPGGKRLRSGIEKSTGMKFASSSALCGTRGNPDDPRFVSPDQGLSAANAMFRDLGIDPGSNPDAQQFLNDIATGEIKVTPKYEKVMRIAPYMLEQAPSGRSSQPEGAPQPEPVPDWRAETMQENRTILERPPHEIDWKETAKEAGSLSDDSVREIIASCDKTLVEVREQLLSDNFHNLTFREQGNLRRRARKLKATRVGYDHALATRNMRRQEQARVLGDHPIQQQRDIHPDVARAWEGLQDPRSGVNNTPLMNPETGANIQRWAGYSISANRDLTPVEEDALRLIKKIAEEREYEHDRITDSMMGLD